MAIPLPLYPGTGFPVDSDNNLLSKICTDVAYGDELLAGLAGGTPGTPGAIVVTVQGTGYSASSDKTRPNNATPYAALTVVADATPSLETFANIGPAAGGKVLLTSLRLEWNVAAIPAGMTYFRLHLFNAAPTAIADGAAFNVIAADRAKYLGFIELPIPLDLGDTLYTETEGMNYPIRKQVTVPSGGTLYGQLQTVGAFTPSAQTTRTLALSSIGL